MNELAAIVGVVIYAIGVIIFFYGMGYIEGKEPGWLTKDKVLKSFIIIPLWPLILAMEAVEALLKMPFQLGKKAGETRASHKDQ